MSFLPDLAGWALGGGAGNNNSNGANEGESSSTSGNDSGAGAASAPLTAEELRAQRVARMELLQQRQAQQEEQQQEEQEKEEKAEPMDIDDSNDDANAKMKMKMAVDKSEDTEKETAVAMSDGDSNTNEDAARRHKRKSPPVSPSKRIVSIAATNTATTATATNPSPSPGKAVKKKAPPCAPAIKTSKAQRKREVLLRKILGVALEGTATAAATAAAAATADAAAADASVTIVDTGSTDITAQTVAEILATRLSLYPHSVTACRESQERSLISYLALCYNRAAEESKTHKHQKKKNASKKAAPNHSNSNNGEGNSGDNNTAASNEDVVESLLAELQQQTVSYAASCVQEPALFDAAEHAPYQLAAAIVRSVQHPERVSQSLLINHTSSSAGKKTKTPSSFYYRLMEELLGQYGDDDDDDDDISSTNANTNTNNNDKPFNKLVETLATAILQPLHEKANTANPSSNPLLPPGAGGTAAALSLIDPIQYCNNTSNSSSSSSNNSNNNRLIGHFFRDLRDVSPTVPVSALQALTTHKRVAATITQLPNFLLPPPDTPAARESIQIPAPAPPGGAAPPGTAGNNANNTAAAAATNNSNTMHATANNNQMAQNPFFRLLQRARQNQAPPPFAARSGTALERRTILGLCCGAGAVPTLNNPAFAPSPSLLLRNNPQLAAAEQSQRQRYGAHANACQFLILNLVKAGPQARERTMAWFGDALLVNARGAAALRRDAFAAQLSSPALLQLVQTLLLQLCQPVVDASLRTSTSTNKNCKQRLIDAGFVSAPAAHRGVFCASGDDAVRRLGQVDHEEQGDDATAMDTSSSSSSSPSPDATTTTAATTQPLSKTATASNKPAYNPKNSFIPQCFFFAARALHFGLCPALESHATQSRHLSHIYHMAREAGRSDPASEPQFLLLLSRQRAQEVTLFYEPHVELTLRFCDFMCQYLTDLSPQVLKTMPEDFVGDCACHVLLGIANQHAKLLRSNFSAGHVFELVVKLLSPQYASMVPNYNLRAELGDVLYKIFLPPEHKHSTDDVPSSVYTDPSCGQTYLLSDPSAQETLAPSLLLLYGEVEHTGHYDRQEHRAKIAVLIQYLWNSSEHRPAFKRITNNKESFIKFSNGIINETNTLVATVMQKLPEIRETQELMKNTTMWGALSEEEQSQATSDLEANEREVKSALPLCNKTLQMFGYLNSDPDIRSLFLLEELRPRLVQMLLHVLIKLVGSKGLDLKVDNPEQYDFRPKEMLRDLCAVFALFATSEAFQLQCAKAGCDPKLLEDAHKTCLRLGLLTGESLQALEKLPEAVKTMSELVQADEDLVQDAPDEFLDEILSTFMHDPVRLPSGHVVDRSTITQHLLNDQTDPFNREPMTVEDIQPAVELQERMKQWLQEQVEKKAAANG